MVNKIVIEHNNNNILYTKITIKTSLFISFIKKVLNGKIKFSQKQNFKKDLVKIWN